MRIWSSSWPSSSSSPWLLRRRRPRRSVRPGPDCQYRCGPVAGQSRREPVARPANIHITLAVQAWRVASFARQATSHQSRAPETESGPPQAARGPPGASSCRQTAARRPPRHQHRRPRRALLRLCVMSSVTLPVTLRAALGRVPCAHHMMRRASMRAEVLTEVANGCGAVTQLLLTWLEVEAHRGPPSFRRHPCQRRP